MMVDVLSMNQAHSWGSSPLKNLENTLENDFIQRQRFQWEHEAKSILDLLYRSVIVSCILPEYGPAYHWIQESRGNLVYGSSSGTM